MSDVEALLNDEQSPIFRITSDGITAPAFEEIRNYLENVAKNIFGNDINLDADTQDGQFVSILALAIHDVNSQAISVYNSFSPLTAKGDGLDRVVKTNGIARQKATNSQVDLEIVGQAGTIIKNGVAIDLNNKRWKMPSVVTIPYEGVTVVSATAEDSGAIEAPEGTITVIGTPTLGWQKVTNTSPAVVGVSEESDSQLKTRQQESTAIPSTSLWEGIIGALLALDGVQRVSGIKNDNDSVSTEGVPGHTIAMIVDGGDVSQIAKTIFNKKGEGVGTYGDVQASLFDSYGFPQTIKFSRPVSASVKAYFKIKPSSTYLSTNADIIKERVVTYVNSLKIGDSVDIGRILASAIKADDGTVDTSFSIVEVKLAKNDDDLQVSSVQIAWNEAASCKTSAVEVEVQK